METRQNLWEMKTKGRRRRRDNGVCFFFCSVSCPFPAIWFSSGHPVRSNFHPWGGEKRCASGLHNMDQKKQAIKIPKGTLKSSLDMLPLPPRPPSMSLSPPPHLFLSIVSTKHPIQAPMTSLKAGSGRPTGQWSHGNKSQFIRPKGWSERGRRGRKSGTRRFHCG